MKITAIKQQVKRKDRYSIYVDGKYSFSLSETALLEQGVVSGQELSAAELKDFKKLSVDDKAYGNTLRYVALRSRSQWELRDYLHRKQVEEPTAEKILNKLRELGFVDDTAFASRWVENRRLLKPISTRRLVQELKQKRVSETIIKAVIDNDETDEVEALRQLVEKKRGLSKYRDNQLKLMQYLARQGFSYDDIKTVLADDL
jgi:regulatory protein